MVETEVISGQFELGEFPFMTAKDRIAKGISPQEPLFGDLLFRKTIAALGGAEDTFKTNWAIQLAICLAMGIPCYSYSCKKSQVAYLILEGGEDYIMERLEEKIAAMGVNREEALQGIYTLDCPSIQLDNKDTIKRLEEKLLSLNPKPDVVILDPITYALDEDVRYSPDKTKLVRNTIGIATKLNGVVILIIHTRKGVKDNANMDDFLGSGQIARAAATRIKLYRKESVGGVDMVNVYFKTRHADRPANMSLIWKDPLLEVEETTLAPREQAKVEVIRYLENAPYNLKAWGLGELVKDVSQEIRHNVKTVRTAIANLEIEGKVEIMRVENSATKIVRLTR